MIMLSFTLEKGILLFGEFPPPPGGMAEQAEILSNCLEKSGLKVFRCRTNISLPRICSFLDKARILRTIARLPFVYMKLLLLLLKIKVVHIFSNSYLNFYLYTCPPLLLVKIFRKRVIINYHGGAAAEFFQKHILWVRPFFNIADLITVPSHYLQEVFESYRISVLVIPNIAHLERFPFRKRDRFNPKFIVTRHLEPEYGIDTVLRAFNQIVNTFPEAKLTVVGDGSQAKALADLAQKLGIALNVSFVGKVNNSELPLLYRQSDIFINASKVDNLPMSIIEAFASGLPVITTRAGGIPYIVENEVTGLSVDIDDAHGLAEMANRLLADSYLATFLVHNARKLAESFSWENVRLKLFKIYQIYD